jgi:hypothetical protein
MLKALKREIPGSFLSARVRRVVRTEDTCGVKVYELQARTIWIRC